MNRHHPYASGYDGPPRRGGGGPSAGPDRSYRGAAPRGRGRGRGGMYGGGPESPGPTPYGLPPPPENGYYGSYDNQAPQQDYSGYGSAYQSAPAAPVAPMYGNPPPANGYEQTYRGYEDTKPPGPPAPGQYNYSGYGPEPTHHRREDRVPDSVINERLSREKPCRTLFVRNIRYETASDEVRRIFEEHGEVKTFFDLIANRGMVFVTYYDLRAAERARDRLQGSEIAGRAIDVHYSLPKDDAGSKNLEMQGTMLVTLQNSRTNQSLDDYELRAVMQTIGDIKSIHPVDNRHDQRYVELYDLRACDMAVDRLRQRPFQDGTLDLILAWNDDDAQSGPPRGGGPRRGGGGGGGRDFDDGPRGRRRRRGGGRGRYGGDGPGHDDHDRGGDWDGDHGRPSYNDGYGPPRPGPDRDYDRYGGPPPPARYGGLPPPPMSAVGSSDSYGAPPPQHYGNAPGPGGGDDRLDKAKKVQQLLEALKQPTSAGTTPQHYPAIGGPSYYGHAAPPPPPSYAGNYQQPSYGGPPSGPPADPRMYGGGSYGGGPPPPSPGQPEPGQPSYEQLRNIFQNQAAAAGRR